METRYFNSVSFVSEAHIQIRIVWRYIVKEKSNKENPYGSGSNVVRLGSAGRAGLGGEVCLVGVRSLRWHAIIKRRMGFNER